MLALGTVLEQKLYEMGELSLKKNAEEIFQSAVNKEFDNQFLKLKLPFQFRYSNPESQFNNCIITNSNEKNAVEIDHDKDKRNIGNSFHKKMEHTILAMENSILIDSLSLLWNKKLQEVGIVSMNAIRIYLKLPKDTIYLISGDSALCTPKYKIADTFFTGLSNEIEIEAFIHNSWTTVMRHSPLGLIITSLLIVCSTLSLSFILFLRLKAKKARLLTPNVLGSNDVQLLALGNLRYEPHLFYVNDKEIRIRPQIASLLLFLLRKPNFYATKNEIIIYLWETDNIGADTRLRRAISDLRVLLKERSVNIGISTEEDGFRLIAQNEPFHRINDPQ